MKGIECWSCGATTTVDGPCVACGQENLPTLSLEEARLLYSVVQRILGLAPTAAERRALAKALRQLADELEALTERTQQ